MYRNCHYCGQPITDRPVFLKDSDAVIHFKCKEAWRKEMSKHDCECAQCGAPLNPHFGIGVITCVQHQPFCDQVCYDKYQKALADEKALAETETGGNYGATPDL